LKKKIELRKTNFKTYFLNEVSRTYFQKKIPEYCVACNTVIRILVETQDRLLDALLVFYKMVTEETAEPNPFRTEKLPFEKNAKLSFQNIYSETQRTLLPNDF